MNKSPAIILINPQMGENIGMVARAMLNCGLTDLRIVNPRDGWPSESADRAASGALNEGVAATIYKTTTEALADLHFTFATTARPRDMIKNVYTPNTAMIEAHEKINQGQNIGVIFGGERAGLINEDVALANAIITIPLNPNFSSLNLSQATLLISYEFMMQQSKVTGKEFVTGKAETATSDTVNNFTNRLVSQLDEHGFFRSNDLKPTTTRNLTNMFTRMDWTDQDVQTLQGILSALVK